MLIRHPSGKKYRISSWLYDSEAYEKGTGGATNLENLSGYRYYQKLWVRMRPPNNADIKIRRSRTEPSEITVFRGQ